MKVKNSALRWSLHAENWQFAHLPLTLTETDPILLTRIDPVVKVVYL